MMPGATWQGGERMPGLRGDNHTWVNDSPCDGKTVHFKLGDVHYGCVQKGIERGAKGLVSPSLSAQGGRGL